MGIFGQARSMWPFCRITRVADVRGCGRSVSVVLVLLLAGARAQAIKICLDPGHGGSDPGATGNGLYEKDVNLDICLRAQSLLADDGWTVLMTRDSDVYVSLQARCDYANANNVDRFISSHCNAFGDPSAQGTETYCHPNDVAEAFDLRDRLNDEIVSHMATSNRGTKTADFYVLACTNAPAALPEVAFITNPDDAAKLASAAYRQEAARAYLHAVQSHYGFAPHDPGEPGARGNILEHNPSFDDYPGGSWKEPYDWAMIWGDYDADWFWRIGNTYSGYNSTCGWAADRPSTLAIRPGADRNVLIGQQGWDRNASYPWYGPMSDMGFTGSTRLVAKVWRKTCKLNLFVGWWERQYQWSDQGGNSAFNLKQGGDCDDDDAEGTILYRAWTHDWCRWVGGAVGVHEGGWDDNGRLVMFDDYCLTFEVAAKHQSDQKPSEIWAGYSDSGCWVRLESFGWDDFTQRTTDWRMKTNNDDAKKIALNAVPAGDQDVQTNVAATGEYGTFYFTCYGYIGQEHDPDGDNLYHPEFYFRREGGDDVNCVRWDEIPANRDVKLTWQFTIAVKGHKPAVRNLTAQQLDEDPDTVRLTFQGHDRRNEPVVFQLVQYRLGTSGSWLAASTDEPSSTTFREDDPEITMDWDAAVDLGRESCDEVYFRIQVSDGVYDSDPAQVGPFPVTFAPPAPGDFDADGDVDEDDYVTLQACYSGPEQPPPPDCQTCDLDADGDVDLLDFATFQTSYTGSVAP